MLPRFPEGTRLTLPGNERPGHRHAHRIIIDQNADSNQFRVSGMVTTAKWEHGLLRQQPLPFDFDVRRVSVVPKLGYTPHWNSGGGPTGPESYLPAGEKRLRRDTACCLTLTQRVRPSDNRVRSSHRLAVALGRLKRSRVVQ